MSWTCFLLSCSSACCLVVLFSAAPVKDLQKLVQDQSTRHPISWSRSCHVHPTCARIVLVLVPDLFEGAANKLVVVQGGDIRSSVREVLRSAAAAKGKKMLPLRRCPC